MKTRTPIRGHRNPEAEPKPRRTDHISGSIALNTEVEKPKPTFAELLTTSGAETPSAFINDLLVRAHSGTSIDRSAVFEASVAIPAGSRVSVFPKGTPYLSAVFIAKEYRSSLKVWETGRSMLKADDIFVSPNFSNESHVQIDLKPDVLTFRASRGQEETIDLTFTPSGEPKFEINIELPEAPSE